MFQLPTSEVTKEAQVIIIVVKPYAFQFTTLRGGKIEGCIHMLVGG